MSRPVSCVVAIALALPLLAFAAPPVAAPPVARFRVIFVGLDGADWELLDGYLASGAMPNLKRLRREGKAFALRTAHPPLSPLVWTTMMTGRSPLDHRVLDFTRFHPATGEREPITSDERRVPAIWSIAHNAGRAAAVFGLWATYPAEPTGSLVVTDRVFSHRGLPPGVVAPAAEAAWVKATLDRVAGEVGHAALSRYLPGLTRAEYARHAGAPEAHAHPVSALLRILFETEAIHALATGWLERESPDLTIVYFQGTDAIGHVFAPFALPRQEGIASEDFDRYRGVPELYFRRIDELLGVYRALAERMGAVLYIASDHGFLWREGRPNQLSSIAAATAGKWHRDEGIELLWAPPGSIRLPPIQGTRRVADVFATLLLLLDLEEAKVAAVAAPEPAAGAAAVDPEANAEALEKLRALGYVAASEPASAPVASTSTRTPASFNNEGLLLRERGSGTEAAAAFEQAIALDPSYASALWNLSDLLARADALATRRRSDDLLVKAARSGLPDGAKQLVARVLGHRKAGDRAGALKLGEAAVAAIPDDAGLRLLRGRDRLESEDCRGAAEDFARAARLSPEDPVVFASLGLARLCLEDSAGAEQALRRSLALAPDQPQVRQALEQLRR